jgi:phosphoadenosine phosphosulfate reductase
MKTKEDIAIQRLLEFRPNSLAFSGGKDSVVCERLFQKSGLPYVAFMNRTTVDPKIHLDFVRLFFPSVYLISPQNQVSMYSLIRDKGLPSRKIRFCCQYLKENRVVGDFIAMGVRQAESHKRRNRAMFHYHPIHKGVKVLNPIIDWTDADVWNYIYTENLPISPLYREPYNFKRVGCIGCPMAGKKVNREFRLFPVFKQLYVNAIKARKKKGFFSDFIDAESVFDWWVSGVSKAKYKSQLRFCMD